MCPIEKKFRNILRQVNAKKPVLGSMIISFLLLLTAFSVLMLVLDPQPVSAAATDYHYNKKITIDHTKVGASLTNFPIWVYMIDAELIGDILATGADLAFYDEANTTRYNHEIEVWTPGTGELGVWVNITSVSSTADTVFYMYYTDSDTSDSRNYNPTSVWDNNYVMVHHMNGSNAADSDDATSNNNDVSGDNGSPTYDQTGKTGESVLFDNATSEYLAVADSASLYLSGGFTFEGWVKFTAGFDEAEGCLISKMAAGTNYEWSFTLGDTVGQPDSTSITVRDASINKYMFINNLTSAIYDNNWHYVVATWDGAAGVAHLNIHVDDADKSLGGSGDTGFVNLDDKAADVQIGANSVEVQYTDGYIDEVRISNTVRSSHWICATYNTTNSPGTFLTVGSEQTALTAANLILPSNMFTLQGELGETKYSNSSGTVHETGEFNFSYNGTQNFSYLRVNITDIHANITADYVAIQVTSVESTWGGTWKTGASGGWSYIYNTSTWTNGNGAYGADPFGVTGIVTNRSIWMKMRVNIPSGIGNETYSNNNCSWDAGYYT